MIRVIKNKGRKSIITQKLINQIKTLKEEGCSIHQISNETQVSRSTIYKVLKNYLGYQSQFQLKISIKDNR